MAKQVSSLSVALKANVGGFNGPMKSTQGPVKDLASSADATGSSLSGLSALAGPVGIAIAGAAAIAGVAFESMKKAAEFETAKVQLTALTGSATIAASTLSGLRDFAKTSPFEFPEILTTSKRLLAAGVNAQALPKILAESGNVAAGVGAPLSDIADIFSRVAVEGSLGIRELRELGRQGIPITQALARELHTSALGVKEMADNGRIGFAQLEGAFDSMTSKGGRFGGILDAQAQTIGGRWHTLSTTIEDDAADVGEKLIKAFHVDRVLEVTTKAVVKLDRSSLT